MLVRFMKVYVHHLPRDFGFENKLFLQRAVIPSLRTSSCFGAYKRVVMVVSA